MRDFLITLSQNHSYLVYALIIILACAEGPVLSMIFGALIKLGYFRFWPIYAALMIGDLVGDVVWYEIGRHAGMRFVRRFGKYFSITEDAIGRVTRIFHAFRHRILFLSKISNGLGFAIVTLLTAGMVRIPFLQYLGINLVGQFIWTGILLGVGYFFGNLYTQVDSWLGKLSIVALFIIVFMAFLGYKKYLKTRTQKLTDNL